MPDTDIRYLASDIIELCEWIEHARTPFHADRAARGVLARLVLYRHRLMESRVGGADVPDGLDDALDRLGQASRDADLSRERVDELLHRIGTFRALLGDRPPRRRPQ